MNNNYITYKGKVASISLAERNPGTKRRTAKQISSRSIYYQLLLHEVKISFTSLFSQEKDAWLWLLTDLYTYLFSDCSTQWPTVRYAHCQVSWPADHQPPCFRMNDFHLNELQAERPSSIEMNGSVINWLGYEIVCWFGNAAHPFNSFHRTEVHTFETVAILFWM